MIDLSYEKIGSFSMIAMPFPIGSHASPVLVTQQSERVWIAKLLTWAGFSVEGNSREDALRNLDQQVKAQLADGEIAYLDLSVIPIENPWLAIAGKYSDDPNWDEYQASIAAARRDANAGMGLEGEGESIA
jgi:predicted RNase H-like HicB family nuclease